MTQVDPSLTPQEPVDNNEQLAFDMGAPETPVNLADQSTDQLPPPPPPVAEAPTATDPTPNHRGRNFAIAGVSAVVLAGLIAVGAAVGVGNKSGDSKAKADPTEQAASPKPTETTPTTESTTESTSTTQATIPSSNYETAPTIPSSSANFNAYNLLPTDKLIPIQRENGTDRDVSVMALRDPNGDPQRFAESFWANYAAFLSSDGSTTSQQLESFTDNTDVISFMQSSWQTMAKDYYSLNIPGFQVTAAPDPNNPPVFSTDGHNTVSLVSGDLFINFTNDPTWGGQSKDGANGATPEHSLPTYKVTSFHVTTTVDSRGNVKVTQFDLEAPLVPQQ